ncbi:YkyA family protein [Thermoflavimicrobium dichotomicum]|uniref:Putative cell-wall binding lipoprotein n=1 Tax=Thermoflavimicrobium dichotomicum TaxID=46223 RepID=A0A1I3LF47_9BACL|nr:YkyA family protein [Thermoflavimicrobium dichotomicum]SFI83424.1 Putative cell-wall binding lipoprotein [Thermoflavimicrobium dichotomicum]
MKKVLTLLLSVFLLSGCSLFKDYYNADQLVAEMEKLVTQENKNDSIINKATDLRNQVINDLNAMKEPDQSKISDLSGKIEEAKKLLPQYKEEVKKIQSHFSDLKSKSARLEDENIKKMAETFINDFMKTTETELKYIEVFEKVLASDEEYMKDLKNGKETKDNQSQLDELNKLHTQLQDEIKQFNESWNQFVQSTTGQEVK